MRGKELTTRNPAYVAILRRFTVDAVSDDVMGKGDITTNAVLRKNSTRIARIIAKEKGIVAGIEEASWFYSQYGIDFHAFKPDGKGVNNGDVIADIKGKEFDLLKTERVGLNLLQRMSGIATIADEISYRARPMLVAATRKTHWSLLDNKAVFIGGAASHRLGLWDSILIKENHIQTIADEGIPDPIEIAIKRAWNERKKSVFIEIETQTPEEAFRASKIFNQLMKDADERMPCIVMLDNFTPDDARLSIKTLKDEGLYANIIIEVSGNITPENISEYRETGADVASMGYLTHSPKPLNMTQLIIRE